MEKDPFKEYLKESEPDKAYKGYARWRKTNSRNIWYFVRR